MPPPETQGPVGRIFKFEEFDSNQESWSIYIERFIIYLETNDVPEAKQVLVFLSNVGRKTYTLLHNLCAPAKPTTKTFNQLVELMTANIEPRPSVISERLIFNKRNQLPTESISDYMAELQKLSTYCEFDKFVHTPSTGVKVTFLQEALRDRLIAGILNENTQRELMSRKTLTFEQAIEIAQSYEAIERNLQTFKPISNISKINIDSGARSKIICHCCGKSGHIRPKCNFRDRTCELCNQKGHLKAVCRSATKRKEGRTSANYKASSGSNKQSKHKYGRKKTHQLEIGSNSDSEQSYNSDSEHSVHGLTVVNSVKTEKIMIDCLLGNHALQLEFDTGCEVSIIPKSWYYKYFSNYQLQPTRLFLKTWLDESAKPFGVINLKVTYKETCKNLKAVIAPGEQSPLFGRDWIEAFGLLKNLEESTNDLKDNNSVNTTNESNIFDRYPDLFKEGLGTFKNFKAEITLKPGATPVFRKARPIPLALRSKVESEIDRLVAQGILRPVKCSEWATPIVTVFKPNGEIRIVGDYSQTVNPELIIEYFPVPREEDLFSELAGCDKFSVIDLSDAFLQMELAESSKPVLTINTSKGLFEWQRMPLGVASSPGIFQRQMELVLNNIPKTRPFYDDILIAGRGKEHDLNLEKTLESLQSSGVQLKKSKCRLNQSELKYLGCCIDKNGLHNLPEVVEAIVSAPDPTNVGELKSFLGFINQYSKFVPNLATILAPLNRLLKSEVKWIWDRSCSEAVKKAKDSFLNAGVLVHYNPKLKLKLVCDASPYGVGSVLMHTMENGEDRPIAFASRSLTSAEKGYAQFDREALAIVFGVKRFHHYLYGQHFTLQTDQKALTWIFGAKSGIPVTAAGRVQRWAVFLNAYSFDLQYLPGKQNLTADSLSRLPLRSEMLTTKLDPVTVLALETLQTLPILATDLSKLVKRDKVLSKVLAFTRNGWPDKLTDDDMKPYFQRRNELSIERNLLFWSGRVIIPPDIYDLIVNELHSGHPGIVRMKSLARSKVWFPNIDKILESKVNSCDACQQNRESGTGGAKHTWEYPVKSMDRMHADFCGPVNGHMFMVVIDAHSKFPFVYQMNNITSNSVIDKFEELFTDHGFCKILVTDNGPQWTSTEFADYIQKCGITHIFSAPFYPASNGQAEIVVKNFKRVLKAELSNGISVKKAIQSYLRNYRITPHSLTHETPAKLFLGRECRSILDCMFPDSTGQVRLKQQKDMARINLNKKERQPYVVDTPVWVRNYQKNSPTWSRGTISEQRGFLRYTVKVGPHTWDRHADQLRPDWAKSKRMSLSGQSEATNSNPASLEVTSNVPEPTRSPEKSPRVQGNHAASRLTSPSASCPGLPMLPTLTPSAKRKSLALTQPAPGSAERPTKFCDVAPTLAPSAEGASGVSASDHRPSRPITFPGTGDESRKSTARPKRNLKKPERLNL